VRGAAAQASLAFRAARRFGHRSAFAGQSFWWTVGGEGFESLALAVVGMPPPTLFADMLTGVFARTSADA
jgi:type VI secretion system protein ImpM